MSVSIAVALGANVGDCAANLQQAVHLCADWMLIESVSSIYQSEPMYVVDQPTFFNAVLVGQTELGPYAVLKQLQSIEKRVGRVRRERNGPREIDLDLLIYGELILRTQGRLLLPHPRLQERSFVLAPWLEIAPDAKVPGLGKVATLAQKLGQSDQNLVRVVDATLHISG